jgi:methylated-DNA-[protein]-cysteine S-methyltransferase
MQNIYIGQTGETPLGKLWVAVSEKGLVAIEFKMSRQAFADYVQRRFKCPAVYFPERVAEAVRQLEGYLAGKRREFTIPIDWSVMTGFQRAALKATLAIPYGRTRTYQSIAIELGKPRAARAVGRAEATNPMPLVIPCHRVLGSDGKLLGYGGGDGLPTKEWLLKLEGARG